MSEYLGGLPEEGGPDQSRAPGRGMPSATAAAQLGLDLGKLSGRQDELTAGQKELRDQQQVILDRQGELTKRYDQLTDQLTELDATLESITENLEAEGGEDAPESEPQPPADWVHVAPEDRAAWLAELTEWVRTTLFVQWPQTQSQLRPCWPLHMGIISDLWLLYRGYLRGFVDEDRRFSDAEHWRRSLDYLMDRAMQTTKDCPRLGKKPHPLPNQESRDDAPVSSLVAVLPALTEAYAYLAGAQEHLDAAQDPSTREDVRAEHLRCAKEFRARSREAVKAAGVSADQFQLFVTIQEGDGEEEGEAPPEKKGEAPPEGE